MAETKEGSGLSQEELDALDPGSDPRAIRERVERGRASIPPPETPRPIFRDEIVRFKDPPP